VLFAETEYVGRPVVVQGSEEKHKKTNVDEPVGGWSEEEVKGAVVVLCEPLKTRISLAASLRRLQKAGAVAVVCTCAPSEGRDKGKTELEREASGAGDGDGAFALGKSLVSEFRNLAVDTPDVVMPAIMIPPSEIKAFRPPPSELAGETARGMEKKRSFWGWRKSKGDKGEAATEAAEEILSSVMLRLGPATDVRLTIATLTKELSQVPRPPCSSQLSHLDALLGANLNPLTSKGVRVLAIDGGGVRGLVALEALRQLEETCGRPVHQLFDYIVGTSTGGLLAVALGLKRMSITECEAMYKNFAGTIFVQDWRSGLKQVTQAAKYDVAALEGVLVDSIGQESLLDYAMVSDGPKVSVVSTRVSVYPACPYVWRSYSFPLDSRDPPKLHGTHNAKIWQALRATSAAPTYFKPFAMGRDRHYDGGITANNPAGIALSEVRALFPTSPLGCLVSVGTGMDVSKTIDIKDMATWSDSIAAWKDIATTLADSASSVDRVHEVLEATLPSDRYFRFQPRASEFDVELDTAAASQLETLQMAARSYISGRISDVVTLSKML